MASKTKHSKRYWELIKELDEKSSSILRNTSKLHQITDNMNQTLDNVGKQVTYPAPKEATNKQSKVVTNVLHKFASYNSLFTLSGLSENEIKSQKYLTNTPHDVIARSGGISDPNISLGSYRHQMDIGTQRVNPQTWEKQGKAVREHTESFKDSVEILAKGHDLFFENLNILSTVGPNPERGLANFTKMEFELHEPFGVTFVEKIRASAFINGYKDYQDAPFLLTIEWKGNNKDGSAGTMPTNSGELTTGFSGRPEDIIKRKIPILISRVEFDVDQGGAKYSAVAVPYGDLAQDDRFKYPRTNLNFSARHLSTKFLYTISSHGYESDVNSEGWVDQIEKKLDEQMEDEIKDGTRQYKDKYKFIVSPEVLRYGKTYLTDLMIAHGVDTKTLFQKLVTTAADLFAGNINEWALNMPQVKVNIDLTTSQADMNTALPKLFEDAIRTLIGYQELVERFWYSWGYARLKERNKPTTEGEAILDYYKSIEFEEDLAKNQFVDWFMIKPNVNTHTERFDKIRKVHPKTITYYAIPVKIHILKFIKPGVSFGNINWDKYVRKQYDYIYTGDNIDVQSLKIFYKTAYYMRNVRPEDRTIPDKGTYREISESLERRINRVLGREDHPYPEPDKPLRQEPSLLKGKRTVSSTDFRAHKSQEFYDYITNPQADMMRIELEILGDPAYICQDMYNTIPVGNPHIAVQEGGFDDRTGSFNAEQYQPLIKLNYRLPDETNLKKGVMFEKQLSVGENLFFNGIYQVTKVESRFQNGEFTQVLTCVRMNNQKGQGRKALFSIDDAKKLGIGVKEEKVDAFGIGDDLDGPGVSA